MKKKYCALFALFMAFSILFSELGANLAHAQETGSPAVSTEEQVEKAPQASAVEVEAVKKQETETPEQKSAPVEKANDESSASEALPLKEDKPAEADKPVEAKKPEAEVIEASEGEQGLTVEVNAPKDEFPSGTTAEITPLESNAQKVSYDITFRDKAQNEVQPADGNEVEVSFTLDASSKLILDKGAVNLKLLHIVDGVAEEIASKVTTGESVVLKAKVKHLSEFRVEAAEARNAVPYAGERGGELKPEVKVTRFQIFKHKHEAGDPPVTSLGLYENFDLELDWDASSYGNKIKENDYFEVQLPKALKFPTSGPATMFDLVDSNGKAVAKGKINANSDGGGNIVVTFTKVVEDLHNVKGMMKLESSFTETDVTVDAENTITITVNGKPVTVKVKIEKPGVIDPGEKFVKYGYDANNDQTKVQWVVRINTNKSLNLVNTIVSDQLSDASAKYIEGTIMLDEVEFLPNGNPKQIFKTYSQEELASMVTFTPDKSQFTLNLGNQGNKTFRLRYQTTYPEDQITNKLIFKGENFEYSTSKTFQSASSSGTGQGNKGKVKIIKVDSKDPSIKLPSATFEIRIKDTNELVETMTTGDNGEAISKTTLNPLKKYKLVETSTPPGYEVDQDSLSANFEFVPDPNKLKTVTIENKRILIDVSGEKTWADENNKFGDRPASVTVQLLADGQEVQGATAEVKADPAGKWQYTFKDVPKYKNVNGKAVEIVYTVKEVVVPGGYKSEVDGMNVKNTYTPKEFEFKFKKTDVAGAELKGAQIKVLREDGSEVASWTSDGTAKEIKLIPGSYSFVETAAPEGYVVATTINFTLAKDGKVTGTDVTVEGSANIITMVDDYRYHDIKISKTDLGGKELPGAKITVKSADGSTLINDGGKAVSSITWTSTDAEKVLKLRAGKYIFHEEAAPEGYLTVTDIEFEVDAAGAVKVIKVAEDDVVKAEKCKLTVADRKKPSVTTEAKANGEKETEATDQVVLTDVVKYKDLIIGKTYVAKLVWMNKATNQPFLIDGQAVTAEKEFIAEQADGEIELSVTVDAKHFVGETELVAFEEVYRDNILVAAHKDINDVSQTVKIKEPKPDLQTEAKANGEKETIAKGTISLADTVNYKNLVIGKTYTLKLVWMDKATGEPFLADGQQLTAEKTFTATQSEGSETLTLEVDAKHFDNGTTLVAFEKLFNDNREVGSHEDLDDAAQKVVIKENFNGVTVSKTDLGGKELPGAKITVRSADGSELIEDNGGKVSTITWTSTETAKVLKLKPGKFVFHEEAAPEGYLTVTDIEFEVDVDGNVKVTKVAEDDVVKAEGSKIAIADRKKPSVTTEAKANGEKETEATDQVVLTDVVKYKDLIIGKTYVAKLVWMDKSTGQPFLIDGQAVTAEKEFIAEQADGEIELSVTVDAKHFVKETKLVAFEEVYRDNILVAAHKDIEDEDQTVVVKHPKVELKTEAKVGGAKEALLKGTLTLTDKVSYKGLVIGKEYTVKLVWMDQATGKEVLVDGKPLTAEKTFVAEKSEGEIELSVAVDSKHLSEGKLVAFETLYANGVEVGAHKDINDLAQTVFVKKPRAPKTGDDQSLFLYAGGFGLAIIALIVLFVLKKRNAKRMK